MQLSDPGLSSILYWWVEEDNLILYPNFMDNRFQSHTAFQELAKGNVNIIKHKFEDPSHFLFLHSLVPTALVRDISQSKGFLPITIILTIEFCTPHLNDVGQALE